MIDEVRPVISMTEEEVKRYKEDREMRRILEERISELCDELSGRQEAMNDLFSIADDAAEALRDLRNDRDLREAHDEIAMRIEQVRRVLWGGDDDE